MTTEWKEKELTLTPSGSFSLQVFLPLSVFCPSEDSGLILTLWKTIFPSLIYHIEYLSPNNNGIFLHILTLFLNLSLFFHIQLLYLHVRCFTVTFRFNSVFPCCTIFLCPWSVKSCTASFVFDIAKVVDGLFPFLKMCKENIDHQEEVKISSITAIP